MAESQRAIGRNAEVTLLIAHVFPQPLTLQVIGSPPGYTGFDLGYFYVLKRVASLPYSTKP